MATAGSDNLAAGRGDPGPHRAGPPRTRALPQRLRVRAAACFGASVAEADPASRCHCRSCMLPLLPCSLAACERRCPLRRFKKPPPPSCAPRQAEPMRQRACAPRRGIFRSVRLLRDDQRPTTPGPSAPTLARSLSLAGLDRARNSWPPSPPWTPVNTATSPFPNSRNSRPPAPIPRTHSCAQLSCSPWK